MAKPGICLFLTMFPWSGERSFLIAAASPSVSRVPGNWKINVKKLTRPAGAGDLLVRERSGGGRKVHLRLGCTVSPFHIAFLAQ